MPGDHPLITLETIALIGVGGFAGSNLRYFVDLTSPGLAGTLLVNTLGSLALGFLLYESLNDDRLGGRTHHVLGAGFLASFTTYSTFILESIEAAGWLLALNVLASYGLGFAGVLAGRWLAATISRSAA